MRSAAVGFWLLIACIAAIGVSKTVLSDTLDPDLFWHLRVAEQMRAQGVHPLVDQMGETGALEDLGRVRAGRDHRPADPDQVRGLQVAARADIGRHAVARQMAFERLLLAVGEAVHGLRIGGVVCGTLLQPDAAALEERAHALQARPLGDEGLVVAIAVERDERLARPGRPRARPRAAVRVAGAETSAVRTGS